MVNLFTQQEDTADAFVSLLLTSGVHVTKQTILSKLSHHADYPSMTALCDVLDDLNIENVVTRISSSELRDIPLPALVQVRINNKLVFATIRLINDRTVEWYDTFSDTKNRWKRIDFDIFVQKWTGVALLIKPDEHSGESNYNLQQKRELQQKVRKFSANLIIFFCLFYPFYYLWYLDSEISLLVCIEMIGTFICILLVGQNLNFDSKIAKKICSIGDSKSGCYNILQSKAASVFSWLSWADIGIIYFSGGLTSTIIILLIDKQSLFYFLFLINILSLPYTVWSIYFQIVVAKQICTLCIIIQLLLWLEFIIFYTMGINNIFFMNFVDISPILWSYIFVSVVWVHLKELINKSQQLFPLKREVLKLKYSEEYLTHMKAKQGTMMPYLDGMFPLVLGNPESSIVITIVTNPTCAACVIQHERLTKLLDDSPDIRCELILVASLKPNEKSGDIARSLFALPPDQVDYALRSWFSSQNRVASDWKTLINAPVVTDVHTQQLKHHVTWCNTMKIQHTPVIYLNGILLPDIFNISEIPYLYRALSAV
ncbi:vitamin K epoxide reductase family protein [uncultured Fibrella sp.]|uniref:vitamin K epoxide reductase family protein n=1 Tax=uncultured Fibrella sp. TaxID=1284596 RepID=UPI0035CB8D55